MQNDLRKLLLEYSSATVEKIQETVVAECKLSFEQIRDRLYLLGNILYEDLENQVYVAYVRAGIGNMSGAILAMQLCGSKLMIAGYAKEGAIKQNLCEKAIQKIKDAAKGKTVSASSQNPRIFLILLAVATISVFVLIRSCVFDSSNSAVINNGIAEQKDGTENLAAMHDTTAATEDPAFVAEVELTIEATKAYNEAVKQFNMLAAEYNAAVELICIDNISGLPEKLQELTIESESYDDNAKLVFGNNSKEMIAADTETILDMTKQVEYAIAVVKQITAPSGEWITERLKSVDGITGTQAVTKNHDPDGLLGKEGGFIACTYFSSAAIDQTTVPGNSIVAKGTDCGGAVEVYATVEDAEARCEYLSGFDGTVLYSGSYAIVGTMVIRTSYKLTNERQLALTDKITSAVTMLHQES